MQLVSELAGLKAFGGALNAIPAFSAVIMRTYARAYGPAQPGTSSLGEIALWHPGLRPLTAHKSREAITLANETDWALVLAALAGEFNPAA